MIEIKAPASKSFAQRAILAATLVRGGQSVVRNVGGSDDVKSAIAACRVLGATITQIDDDLHISGAEKLRSGAIDVGESGLLTRLIAPVVALTGGTSQINGHGTLNSRPMHSLLKGLDQFGITVSSNGGYLPIKINGEFTTEGRFLIDGNDGSQVLSGLLTALPLSLCDTTIEVANLKSRPYIDLTISILGQFGIEIENNNYTQFKIKGNQRYLPVNYTVEGDWSGASCFIVANAIIGGDKLQVTGLDPNSIQADRKIISVIEQSKGLKAFDFDASHSPDLFPALVTLAAHCDGESRITGTSRLAHKESARDLVLQSEWAKLGVEVDLTTDNTMIVKGIAGRNIIQTAPIDPHGDHRIAMAAAMMGRRIIIENKGVVAKSFPDFWTQHQKIEHLL